MATLLRLRSVLPGAGDSPRVSELVPMEGSIRIFVRAATQWGAELEQVIAAQGLGDLGARDTLGALKALLEHQHVLLVVRDIAPEHLHTICNIFECATRALASGEGKTTMTIVLEGWTETFVTAPMLGVSAVVMPLEGQVPPQVLISPSGRLLADTVSTLGGTPAAAGMLARGVSGSEEATALLLRVARGDIAIAPMQPAPVPPPQVAQPAPVVPVAPVVVAPPVVVAAPVALVAASVVVAPVVSAPVVAGPAQVVAAAPRVAPAASRPPAARGPVVPEKKAWADADDADELPADSKIARAPPAHTRPAQPRTAAAVAAAAPARVALVAAPVKQAAPIPAKVPEVPDHELAAATAASVEDESWVTIDKKKKKQPKQGGGAAAGGEREERSGNERRPTGDRPVRDNTRPPREGNAPRGERPEGERRPPRTDNERPPRPTGPGVPRGPPMSSVVISPGPVPDDLGDFENGMIFGCKKETSGESEKRGLLGLPVNHIKAVEKIQPGKTALFVFHYNSRELHALYVPICPGGLNLETDAYVEIAKKLHNKHGAGQAPYPEGGSPFPAQVRYKPVFQFTPLQEWQWQHVVDYQKYTQHFKFFLEKDQVAQLMQLFRDNHGKPQAPRAIQREMDPNAPPRVTGGGMRRQDGPRHDGPRAASGEGGAHNRRDEPTRNRHAAAAQGATSAKAVEPAPTPVPAN
eukprot:CAMPEP_0179965170 /NCGR_PEP_ID=MMETSP0983-20121128/31733_1 /TAXON_ID=483367 /ORGANISM="non described non described, Strain CCMP 2436" /LENGTH=694 /DNA_ID=CAMNT_0021877973 /DNA_START=84 /DNA_END=2168 /DNA_ORIENTATION=+